MAIREVEKNFVIRAEQVLETDDESRIIEVKGLLIQVTNIMNILRENKIQINFNIANTAPDNPRLNLSMSVTKMLV